MRGAVLAAAAALALSCSELPDVDHGECGNKIVDEDEWCDTFAPEGNACGAPRTVNECLYVCDEATGATCPEGWDCGVDQRCRFAIGLFSPSEGGPWRLNVHGLEAGDVDGDGNLDLIGTGGDGVEVRLGTPSGQFPVDVLASTRSLTGPVEYARFSGDARLDAVVPTDQGLYALLGDPDSTLSPVAYAPFEIENTGGLRLVPLEADPGNVVTEILVIADTEAPPASGLVFLDSDAPGVPLPPGFAAGDVVGRVPVADLDRDGRDEVAVALAGARRVWIYGSVETELGFRPELLGDVFLPGTVLQGARFADVNGDGWGDLMVSILVDDFSAEGVAVAYGDGTGRVAAGAGVEPVFQGLPGSPWPLAAGQLGGDAKADYVGRYEILIADVGTDASVGPPTSLYPTVQQFAAEWSEAQISSFNGDYLADVAVATGGAAGVDVYLGTGVGIFNRFHVGTDDPATSLRVGDFDGDFVADLAFAETPLDPASPDALFAIYGATSGGPSEAVFMGELDRIEQMEPLYFVAGTPDMVGESLDLMTDLLVVSVDLEGRGEREVALMQGSSERRLLSPFALSPEPGADPDRPLRVLAGRFGIGDGIGKDLVVIAAPPGKIDPAEGEEPPPPRFWLLPGQGDKGGIDGGGKRLAQLPADAELDPTCAEWIAIDLDGDGRDEVAGIDENVGCVRNLGGAGPPKLVVARISETGVISFEAEVAGDEFPFRVVRDLVAADIDRDGATDLLVSFEGQGFVTPDGGEVGEGGPGIAVLWNRAGALSLADAATVAVPDTWAVYSARPIELDGDPDVELAVLAGGGIYAAGFDTASGTFSSPQLVLFQNGEGRLAVGDFDRDGLDDLAWTEGADLQVWLACDVLSASACGVFGMTEPGL